MRTRQLRPHLGAPNPQLCCCPVLCYRRVSPSPATSNAIDHKGCRSPLVLSRRSLESHREPARGLGTRSLWRPCPQAGDTAAAVCMEHDAAGHPGCSRSQAGRGGQRCGYVTAHRFMHTHGPSAAMPVPCAALRGNARARGAMATAPKQLLLLGTGSSRAGHRGDAVLELSSEKGTGASRAGCRLAAPQHRTHFWGCRRARPHTAARSLCHPRVPAVRCSGAPRGSGGRAAPGGAADKGGRALRSGPGPPLRALLCSPRPQRERGARPGSAPTKRGPAPPPPFVSGAGGAAPGADKGAGRDARGIKISLINPRRFAPWIVPPESTRELRGGTARGITGAVRGSEPSLCRQRQRLAIYFFKSLIYILIYLAFIIIIAKPVFRQKQSSPVFHPRGRARTITDRRAPLRPGFSRPRCAPLRGKKHKGMKKGFLRFWGCAPPRVPAAVGAEAAAARSVPLIPVRCAVTERSPLPQRLPRSARGDLSARFNAFMSRIKAERGERCLRTAPLRRSAEL